ncbi:transcriptional regulator sugar kinase [Secundilactobacillus paracollinoides DSM 15502 = JCM 11969]|nr:transcriptional regulator sugar kinase [Secundilactobacillus paracollinoides DSM 15502 = JCM 11969]
MSKMADPMIQTALLAVDIGGTSVKTALWRDGALLCKRQFETPATWEGLLSHIEFVKDEVTAAQGARVTGIAVSLPGSVDTATGTITGTSAVHYLNAFPVRDTMAAYFHLPVSLQNDANCAALAEAWLGNARDVSSAVLMVVGTGIGGAIVRQQRLVTSHDNFAGEFGYMEMTAEGDTLSELASPVKMARRYGEATHQPDISDRADAGEAQAQRAVNLLYHWLSVAAYNLVVGLNPDRLLIGGGISARSEVIDEIRSRVMAMQDRHSAQAIQTDIQACHYLNDANLVGAVRQFELERIRKGD